MNGQTACQIGDRVTEHEHDKRLVGKDALMHLAEGHGINIEMMPLGTRASTFHDNQHDDSTTIDIRPKQTDSRVITLAQKYQATRIALASKMMKTNILDGVDMSHRGNASLVELADELVIAVLNGD